jgi:UDP-N-acetylmuramoyl-tripeptide--D-alanyl-D-alanine ligase
VRFDNGHLVAADIAEATGGRVIGGSGDVRVSGVTIDSRQVQPGDLFFAIVAARDGHEYAAAAVAAGAVGVVVARHVRGLATGERKPLVIEVPETTRALQDLGRAVRRASGARVVAITGSAGKTTTKEAAAEMLSARYRVVSSRGNLNNHLGLPLSLMELRHGADVAVMELGMNRAGEIRVLVGVAEPELRVWTNVGDAHIGHFGSADALAEAKAEILEQARPADVLVANADDARVMAHASRFAGRVATFGLAEGATVRATAVEDRGLEGTVADIDTPVGRARLGVPLLGRGNLANVLAAATISIEMDVPLDAIVACAARLTAAPGRGAVVRLPDQITLIDDTYNSSPSALAQALEVLARTPQRRVAVAGEMLELGEQATALHAACGRAAARAGLAVLVAVGGAPAEALAAAAREEGMPPASVHWVATSAEAADLVSGLVRPGDVVLVKGSRGVRTEVVARRLRGERG